LLLHDTRLQTVVVDEEEFSRRVRGSHLSLGVFPRSHQIDCNKLIRRRLHPPPTVVLQRRTPAVRSLALAAIASPMVSRRSTRSRITLTSALPTTTPSACAATSATCSRFEIPKPTTTGTAVWRLIAASASGMLAATASRSPVTPSRDT